MKKNDYSWITGIVRCWNSKLCRSMRTALFLIIVTVFQGFAAKTYSQGTKISLDMKNQPIVEILQEIEEKSEYFFLYDATAVDVKQVSSVTCIDKPIDKVLNEVFEDTDISFKISDRLIALKSNKKADALKGQQKSVTGTVTDEAGEPLPGVTVIIKGTTNGTVTNFDGVFTLSGVEAESVLQLSFVGMLSQEITVGDQKSIRVTMKADAIGIEEVVAVGYGVMRKSDVTGSVKSITAEDFNAGVVSSPTQLLTGKVAGVNITTGTGEPGGAVDINIRGINSIGGGSAPLFVVDGVPIDAVSAGGTGIGGLGSTRAKNPFNFINPQDIESITILKDASATAIYGTKAANGVVLIETKKGKSGEGKVTFDSYVSFSKVANKIDLLSADEYKKETARLGALIGRTPESYIDPANANTDWQDEIYRTAISQNHNVSFSGGTGKSVFSASVVFFNLKVYQCFNPKVYH